MPPDLNHQIKISATDWADVDHPTRRFYLKSCMTNLRRVASSWVKIEAELRGHHPKSEEGAESWLLGPVPVARSLRYLGHGLKSGGRPRVASLRLRIDGRSISRIFPYGFHENLLFWGVQAHVWSVGSEIQGLEYRQARDTRPGPALVLGASNVSSICATDVLHKLFNENRPVVCKIPPRFEALEKIYKEVFYPLVRDGHLQFLSGGANLGRKLVKDPIFETVHVTGSFETYQSILADSASSERPVTAELGCVTPCLITPGQWSAKDLRYQARHLASLLQLNGGYNCVTPQIVLLAGKWPQKDEFLRVLRGQLSLGKRRDDLYPGIDERRTSFRQSYPDAELFGPRSLVELDPGGDERLFQEEAFCGMLGLVELDAETPEDFLKKATEFCNTKLWGDLSCLVLIDNETRQQNERQLAQTLTALQYGTIGLNVFAGLAFASSVTPWGSYRGGKQSTGTGWVHNPFFFDHPEKTVIESNFLPPAPLPWVKPFKGLYDFGEALFRLDSEPSGLHLGQVVKNYTPRFLRSLLPGNEKT